MSQEIATEVKEENKILKPYTNDQVKIGKFIAQCRNEKI